jgi:hypothetical protein
MTPADRLPQLMLTYPAGCAPPSLAHWHDWADAQHGHGLTQEQCSCGRWLFPQEAHTHGEVLA